DQIVNQGDLVTLHGSFTDAGGFGPYTFLWTQTSGVPVPFDAHVASPTFTPDKVGDYLFVVRVTDAAGNFSDDAVSIRANNVAPVLSHVAVTAVINEGGTVTLAGDVFDAGSDALTVTVNW